MLSMSENRKDELSLSEDHTEEHEAQPLRIDEASDEPQPSRAASQPATGLPQGVGEEEDEDDETWTNQPPSSRDSSPAADLEEGDEDEGDDRDEEVEQTRASRRAIQNGRDVLCEELPERAQRAAIRLKPFLTGVLVVEFTNSGERFVFDWRDDAPKTLPISRDVAVTLDTGSGVSVANDKVQADAIIALSEQHVMSIRSGDLNPQIGMLTEKIRVKGKVSPAVYLFNLIAPRSRN
jgi:hypothetical protein